jgi:tetratricopeptide (TPR) repeat protein
VTPNAGAAHTVFISYARATAAAHARSLAAALGKRAFLDTRDLPDGEPFPATLADAVLDARVAVIFADSAYFLSRFCRAERLLALSPRPAPGNDPGRDPAHLVIALGPDTGDGVLDNLAHSLRERTWPHFEETARIVTLVETRLAAAKQSIREMDPERCARVLKQVLAGLVLPLPQPPGDITAFPQPLPRSIHDRFVGRESEMERLHQALWQGGSAALTGALRGGAGFGKTRLAIEYFRRYGPLHYKGGLFWLNAEGDLTREFHGMIEAIRRVDGRPTPGLDEFDQKARAAKRELVDVLAAELGAELRRVHACVQAPGAAQHARVLFVADNVPEAEPGEPPPPLSRWCPALDEVTLLATSRADLGEVDPERSIKVSALKESAAVELLRRDLSGPTLREIDDEGWKAIAKWVGCHARVLETLNATLAHGGKRPRDLLALARSAEPLPEIGKQEKALRPLVPRDNLRGIAEALRVSYDTLPPASQRTARLLALLAPDPIPDVLLKKLMSEEDVLSVRMTLPAHSWVEQEDGSDQESAELFGAMHRLMAEFLRSMSSDPAGELRVVVQVLNAVLEPHACRDPGRWKELNPCQPHADHVFDRALAQDSAESGVAEWEAVVTLGDRVAILRHAQGLAGAARRTQERAVELARAKLGTENSSTLIAMNNLAGTMCEQGDLDGARKLQEETLAIKRRVLGAENPSTLVAMMWVAESMRAQGDLDGARKLIEETSRIQRRLLGAEHPSTLLSMKTLAATMQAQGDLDGARKLIEDTLGIQRRVLGAEHPNTLTSMMWAAATMMAQGDLDGARKLYEETLAIQRRVLGAEHPHTLTSMMWAAATLKAQGDLAGARQLNEETLTIYCRVLGAEHPETTSSGWNLFRALEDLGERDAAQAVLDRHLLWLLRRDPATLGARQRELQGHLRNLPSHGFRIE